MKHTLSQLIDYRNRANQLLKLVSDAELIAIYKERVSNLNEQIQNYQE